MTETVPLYQLTVRQAWIRFCYYAAVPFWVSLVVSIPSLALDGRWDTILVAAISGQMALTLIKLLVYSAGLALSIATALRGFCFLPKVLRYAGERLGGVAFDYSSAVVGVLIGILPVAMCEKGVAALLATIWVASLMLAAQFLVWASCFAAFGKLKKHVREAPWLPRVAGVAFAGLFIWAFHHENWPEVPEQSPTSVPKDVR
jgi:hypothetical protein